MLSCDISRNGVKKTTLEGTTHFKVEMDDEDYQSLRAFREKLKSLNHYPTRYKSSEDLQRQLSEQIDEVARQAENRRIAHRAPLFAGRGVGRGSGDTAQNSLAPRIAIFDTSPSLC